MAKRISLETGSNHVKSNKSKQQNEQTILQKVQKVKNTIFLLHYYYISFISKI